MHSMYIYMAQGDKISDNNETRMRRMVSVSLCACVNSPTFPAKAEASSLYRPRGEMGESIYVSAGRDTGAIRRSGKLLQYRHEQQRAANFDGRGSFSARLLVYKESCYLHYYRGKYCTVQWTLTIRSDIPS